MNIMHGLFLQHCTKKETDSETRFPWNSISNCFVRLCHCLKRLHCTRWHFFAIVVTVKLLCVCHVKALNRPTFLMQCLCKIGFSSISLEQTGLCIAIRHILYSEVFLSVYCKDPSLFSLVPRGILGVGNQTHTCCSLLD